MSETTAAFVARPETIDYVYGDRRRREIADRTTLLPQVISPQEALETPERLKDIDVIFSTWSMPALDATHLEHMPKLSAVFYAAGSVQSFARPLLRRDIAVISAWRANAIIVAEFTLAQILLSLKGYFRNLREYDGSRGTYSSAYRGPGAYGETVSLLGAGAVGTHVIELLKPFHVNVVVFDPFLEEARARDLGVEKVPSAADAFRRGFVVSNHLANNPATVKLIDQAVLDHLRPNAVFINTGRGATVDETALCQILKARADLTALLDVTDPEPPGPGAELVELPNVHLTTHIAGGINDEVKRMADLCIDEFDRYSRDEPLEHAVTLEALDRLA